MASATARYILVLTNAYHALTNTVGTGLQVASPIAGRIGRRKNKTVSSKTRITRKMCAAQLAAAEFRSSPTPCARDALDVVLEVAPSLTSARGPRSLAAARDRMRSPPGPHRRTPPGSRRTSRNGPDRRTPPGSRRAA